ncbi:MAG: hypothetical protein HYY50_03380 [Candidatus Kerfeldbacteria bacterium]|nr:hypothetical protein [Candidatus Kerfeldbacteria bacterium]
MIVTHHDGWRVPDGVFTALGVVAMATTWFLLIYFFQDLTATVPVQFMLTDQLSGYLRTSWWLYFLPGWLQLVLGALVWWLYRRPEYTNIPTSFLLPLVPDPLGRQIRQVIRHVLVMSWLLVNLLLAYGSLGMVTVGLGLATRLQAWPVYGILLLLLVVIGFYGWWLSRLGRQAADELRRHLTLS